MKHTSFAQTNLQDESIVEIRKIHTPVVIERTAKIYKLGMLTGWVVMLMGVLMTVYSLHVFVGAYGRAPYSISEFLNEQRAVYVSLSGIVIGFLIYRFEKLLAWWNNG